MCNYLKIYLLFLIPSCFALGVGFYSNYSGETQKVREDFIEHYSMHTQIYAEQIQEIERFYEKIMKNAAFGIKKEIFEKKMRNIDLRMLAKKYNVSHLFLINKDGMFTDSTNEDPTKIPNLFSFSSKYRELIEGQKFEYLTTPIILPFPEKEPHKFLTIWTGKRFIEVGVRITDIAKNITKILNRDKNILLADMKIGKESFTVKSDFAAWPNFLVTTNTIKLKNEHYVQSKQESEHNYGLQFHISKEVLNIDISKIAWRYIINFSLTIGLIAVLLLLAITVLRKRVEAVTRSLLKLSKNGDYNRNLSLYDKNKDIRNLIKAINSLLSGYRESNQKSIEKERVSTINSLTAQVAHDIRSPLEALKMTQEELSSLKEEDRLKFKTAINRIEEIAYSLLKMKKDDRKTEKVADVQNIIEQILIEKRMQYKAYPHFEIKFKQKKDFFGSFISINPDCIKRILSNLITNSAESLSFKGYVEINLTHKYNILQMLISDNSSGFPLEYLKDPFKEGITTKEGGNGLGLYHAKRELEAVGGKIEISNRDGANVILEIPMAITPNYFLKKIDLLGVNKIIILDDDENIHNIWSTKFRPYSIMLEHFFSGKSLLEKYKTIPEDCLLLSDYELLGEKINGIDCIEKLNSVDNSILITARSDEKEIIKRSEEINLSLLPKNMAFNVPIKKDGRSDIVLIDDDELVHMTWKKTLTKRGHKLASYYSVDEFLENFKRFNTLTPIYIDSNLGDGLRGEVLSEKIFKLGFNELYITTGYEKDTIAKPSWINSVIGKAPLLNLYDVQ